MVSRARTAALLALSCALALAASASAQETDASRAERLFLEGRDARDKNDQATACARFAESLALVTRASTLVNLATCEEKLGKLVSSMAHAKEALTMMPPSDERAKVARDVVERAGQRAPRVTLRLPADAPAGARVRLDGTDLDRNALAAALTLDPGAHEVVVSAAGRADATTKVTLVEGRRGDVALALGGPEKPGGPVVTPDPGAAPDRSSPRAGGSSRRTLGYVVGGVGVVGLAAAGITGGVLLANDGTISESCKNKLCDQDGLDAIDRSETLIVVNYIAWGVGIAGVGAGVLLILTSPSGQGRRVGTPLVSPWAGPHGAGLTLRRSF